MIKWSGRGGIKWKMLPLVQTLFRLTGGKWTHFYGWMLDRQERNNSISDIIGKNSRTVSRDAPFIKGLYDVSTGPLFVDFLKEEGVLPHHRFLDFGCGYGRVGIPLLRYLQPGHYVGIDLSSERVRLAKEYVAYEQLESMAPEFYPARKDNSLEFLAAASFDVIWAFSVFSHMPIEDVSDCLAQLKRLLKHDGVLIANYDVATERKVENISAFWVPEDEMKSLVVELGFDYEDVPDWAQRLSPNRAGWEKMFKLRHTFQSLQ